MKDLSQPLSFKARLMDGSFLFIVGLSLTFATACYVFKGPDVFWHSLDDYVGLLMRVMPVVLSAIVMSAFLQALIPPDIIRRALGSGSPARSVLVGSVAGAVVPGGPLVSMPVLQAIMNAGADRAACVAFYISWTTLAFHRVIQWEVPLLGLEFTTLRYLVSIPLPFVAGGIAMLVVRWLNRRATAAKPPS